MRKTLGKFMAFLERHDRAILILLVVGMILAGSLYSIMLPNHLRFADEIRYRDLATHLAHDHVYSIYNTEGHFATAYRPPGYPFFLTPFVGMGASIALLRILNFLAFGATLYLVYLLLRRHCSRSAGVLGALIVACYPVLFFTAGALYPQTLSTTVFLLIIHLLTREKVSTQAFVGAGLLFGFLIWMVPTFGVAIPMVAVWYWLSKRPADLRRYALTILSAALLMSVWTARNYIVFHTFIPVSSNSGYNLLVANNENVAFYTGAEVDISKYTNAADQAGMRELERDKFYRAKALEWIKNNKGRALEVYLMRVLYNFNFRNKMITTEETSRAKDLVMLMTYGPLLLLFVVRLLLAKRYPVTSFEALLILVYLAYPVASGLFLARLRYRLPFDPLMIMAVAAFIARVAQGSATPETATARVKTAG